MASTQMLLLVLIVIIVGVAIIIAVSMFNENAAADNLNRVSAFLTELAVKAQTYYKTPIWLGGGGRSFTQLTANQAGMQILTNISVNEIGTFSILVAGTDSQVTLQGVGTEDGDRDGTNCTVNCQVFADSISTQIINR